MGTINNIERIKIEDLKKYKQETFTASNMIFCITGNLTDAEFRNLAKSMESIPISNIAYSNEICCPKNFGCRYEDIFLKYVNDDNPLEVNLSFDITYDSEEKELLTILNCIVGEGVGSKL